MVLSARMVRQISPVRKTRYVGHRPDLPLPLQYFTMGHE
jgi:hypothetical protein